MDEALGNEPGSFDKEAAKAGETSDAGFEERARTALAKELGVEPDALKDSKTFFPFDERESASFEGAGGEYTVFNEDDAEAIALAAVRNDFEGDYAEGFDLFKPEFLMSHVDKEALKNYMEQVFDEFARQDVGELSVSEKDEWLDDKAPEGWDTEVDHEDAEIEAEFAKYEEEWIEAYIAERLGDDGGQSWWTDNVGEDDFKKIVKDQGFYDVEAIIQDAVDIDGPGHYMNSYDGAYHELADGLAYIRTN